MDKKLAKKLFDLQNKATEECLAELYMANRRYLAEIEKSIFTVDAARNRDELLDVAKKMDDVEKLLIPRD